MVPGMGSGRGKGGGITRWGSARRSERGLCNYWMSVQAGLHRRSGEGLPHVPVAQGRGQVAHGILQEQTIATSSSRA